MTQDQILSTEPNTLLDLHLHMMDRSMRESQMLINGDQEVFSQLLDFDLDADIEESVAMNTNKKDLDFF